MFYGIITSSGRRRHRGSNILKRCLAEHLPPAAVYYFLKRFLFYPSTCVGFTSHTTCSTSLFVSAMFFFFFWCFHSLQHRSPPRNTVIFTARRNGRRCYSTHIHARVWSLKVATGPSVMSWNEGSGCGDEHVARKDKRKTAVSYCRFPSLHTCIIQFNIFTFYGPKYSWMIRAQGELVGNLVDLRKLAPRDACFGRSCFFCPFFFPPVPPCFNEINIATSLYPRVLCYVTPSPANEIMNSWLDTKADEGIFEHSKSERGEEKRERTFPKLIFISRVHAYLIESAWIS